VSWSGVEGHMPRIFWIATLCLSALASSLGAQPQFDQSSVVVLPDADRVLLAAQRVKTLWPGAMVAIHGSGLGPETVCEAQPVAEGVESSYPGIDRRFRSRRQVYPKELCGVRVMVGDTAAGLAYVRREQVNFQVPPDMPFTITAPVRVIYEGISSDPVLLQFGSNTVTLSQDGPAYTGMPVWVRAQTDGARSPVGYPFSVNPLGHPCIEVEVRKDGALLPPILPKSRMKPASRVRLNGNICGGFPWIPELRYGVGRVPLHLFYHFDVPGTYEVRYWQSAGRVSGNPEGEREGSSWTEVKVVAAVAEQRRNWLRETPASTSRQRAELLSDILPSLMGYDDRETLPILVRYLYSQDELVRSYTMWGLADYFNRQRLLAVLNDAVRREGKNHEVDLLLNGFEVSPPPLH
jgi:hypothetical protein